MAKVSATTRIADSVRIQILDGELRPGERIAQEKLAEEFGVSRLPVREALRVLEAEDLVRLVPHSGAWVSVMDANQVNEIYLIRERLDSLLLSQAVPEYTDEFVDELQRCIERIEAATSIAEYMTLDRDFHLLSYQPAPMERLYTMVEGLWNTTQHYRRAFSEAVGWDGLQATHMEHRMMLTAFRNRDASEAGNLMALHLRRTRKQLTQHPELFG